MTARGPAVLLLSILCASCGPDTQWADAPPPDLHGVWIQQSEDVARGIEFADTVRVSPDTLIHSDPHTDGALNRRVCTPIRSVSRNEDLIDTYFVIFCGRPNDDHVAEIRIEIDPNERFDEAVVGEVVGTGWGEDAYFSIGRFAKVR